MHQLAQREAQVEPGQLGQVDEDAHNPLRRASQAVRIARAGGPLAGGKHPRHRIELVGQRHRRPGDRRLAELFLASAARSASTPTGR